MQVATIAGVAGIIAPSAQLVRVAAVNRPFGGTSTRLPTSGVDDLLLLDEVKQVRAVGSVIVQAAILSSDANAGAMYGSAGAGTNAGAVGSLAHALPAGPFEFIASSGRRIRSEAIRADLAVAFVPSSGSQRLSSFQEANQLMHEMSVQNGIGNDIGSS